ncbi:MULTISPECIES: c-type cytochrome [unclassified Bartonella]|uniref:c-type cytochrome n=1 Tax=unclassified Bartonella TaxID=2645622 RepID=UPI00099A3820|nr:MULTISPECIES: cytochrome c family protein [unclassified Bartonella]AQX27472.1 cytochrome c [Bartonella sp. JB15]AQX28752.1 cytochrome c [Bartonella sp. JB63]
MNRSTFICLICACLLLVIVLVGFSTMSDIIYDDSVQHSYKRYKIISNETLKKTQNISDKSLLLSELLKQGDLENGRKVFRQCAICHTSKRDESNRIGPSLWGIVNRPFAIVKNFSYSKVLRANSDRKWDFFTLDRYIQSPRQAFPGTIMSFRGIKNDQDRADLLLYLRSLSDHHIPLPQNDKQD